MTSTAIRQRPRGFVNGWSPQVQTTHLLAAVRQVLDEYSAQLPLTARQIFYRLVGTINYEKTEQAYKRLLEALVMARRSRLIPFDAIRDDGPAVQAPPLYLDAADWVTTCQQWAATMRLSPWPHQPVYVEVICEAGGMVPMLARVADPYGITVRSGGGFDSLTAKYNLARVYAQQDRPTLVLHVGDYDPSGEALWRNLAEDVAAFCSDMGGSLQVHRLAVTAEQQATYGLPTAPPKRTDKRSCFTDSITVQAEALPPDLLQTILREAIESAIDLDALEVTRSDESEVRANLSEQVANLR